MGVGGWAGWLKQQANGQQESLSTSLLFSCHRPPPNKTDMEKIGESEAKQWRKKKEEEEGQKRGWRAREERGSEGPL